MILGGKGLTETEGILAKARKWLELSSEKESGARDVSIGSYIYISV